MAIYIEVLITQCQEALALTADIRPNTVDHRDIDSAIMEHFKGKPSATCAGALWSIIGAGAKHISQRGAHTNMTHPARRDDKDASGGWKFYYLRWRRQRVPRPPGPAGDASDDESLFRLKAVDANDEGQIMAACERTRSRFQLDEDLLMPLPWLATERFRRSRSEGEGARPDGQGDADERERHSEATLVYRYDFNHKAAVAR